MQEKSLGDRMKEYENLSESSLMKGLPYITRCDGKTFHSWTRGLDRPYDTRLIRTMDDTAKNLLIVTCADIAYVQSDEISLVFVPKDIKSDMRFSGRVQKLASVTASQATVAFNKAAISNGLSSHIDKKGFAVFDARVFSVPTMWEAVNALIFREEYAVRNSIQSLGQANFSHKLLQGKSCKQIQEMLFTEKAINWHDLSSRLKKGSYFVKKLVNIEKAPEKPAVFRTVVKELDIPRLSSIANPAEVLFENAEVVLKS